MTTGWVRLWRKLHDSSLYKSLTSKQRDVMIQCLLLANHDENEWTWLGQDFKCEPGQFITSLSSLVEKCAKDVSTQSVRGALLKLERMEFLTNKSTKTGRLITICNWETYQPKEENNNKDANKDANKEVTKTQQRPNKEVTTNKNDNNYKNVIKNISFQNFWDIYDKKKERTKCEKKWNTISESEKKKIMDFIPIYHKSEPNEQYRKNPYTFLNSQIWNDDPKAYQPKGDDFYSNFKMEHYQ